VKGGAAVKSDILPARRMSDLQTECSELIAILTTIIKTLRGKSR
jgi:hypothetical protein